MKKLLTLLTIVGLTSTTTVSVISCGQDVVVVYLGSIIPNLDLGNVDANDASTILDLVYKLNKISLDAAGISQDQNELKVDTVSETSATISTTNDNYQGSVVVTFKVRTNLVFPNLALGNVDANDASTILDLVYKLNETSLVGFGISRDELQIDTVSKTSATISTTNDNYQGSVVVTFRVRTKLALSNLDLGNVNDNNSAVLDRVYELNETSLVGFGISRDELQIDAVSETSATISTTNDNYQGSVVVTFKVRTNLVLSSVDLGILNDNDASTILDLVYELNEASLVGFGISRDELQIDAVSETSATISTTNDNYQGSVVVTFKVRAFLMLPIVDLGNVDVNDASTILDQVYELNETSLVGFGISRDELQISAVSETSATISTTNDNYQGSVVVTFKVRTNLVLSNLDLGNVNDNNSAVLDRVYELNKTSLDDFGISRDELQISVVSDTSAIVSTTNDNYQGSVVVTFKVRAFLALPNLDLGSVDYDDVATILEQVYELNEASLVGFGISRDELQISVVSNTSAIVSTTNDNYQGSVDVTFKVDIEKRIIDKINTYAFANNINTSDSLASIEDYFAPENFQSQLIPKILTSEEDQKLFDPSLFQINGFYNDKDKELSEEDYIHFSNSGLLHVKVNYDYGSYKNQTFNITFTVNVAQ